MVGLRVGEPSVSRRAIVTGLAAGAGAVLAACGLGRPGQGADGGVPPPPGRLGPAELRFSGWWSAQQVAGYEAQVAAFAQGQPGVRIQLEPNGNLDKFLTQIAGGSAPDVYWVNNDQTPVYVSVGALVEQGPLAARDRRELGTFLEGSQAQYAYRGKQYALTDFTMPMFTHFHTELLRKAGLKRPASSHKDKGWATQDLLELARKLTVTQGSEVRQFGYYVGTSSNRYFPVLWAFGGDIFDDAKEPKQLKLNSPQNVAAVEWLADLRVRHHVTPTVAEDRALGWANRWRQGQVALLDEGPWSWPAFSTHDFTWDLLPVVRGPAGRWTRLAGAAYGIWTGSTQREAAWQWVKFLVSPAGLKLSAYDRTRLQGVPSQKVIVEDPQWATFLTPEAKRILAESSAHGRSSPLHPKWAQMQKVMDAEMLKAFDGTVAARVAVTQAHEQVQAVFAGG